MNGLTGLMVDIRPDLPPHSLLRFDIDCVDVNESCDPDHKPATEGFASINENEFHACGHDGHAAIGLGVAMELMRRQGSAEAQRASGIRTGRGRQPGSPSDGQRRACQRRQILPCRPYRRQCGPGPSARVRNSGFLATTKFDVELFGLASHSGADPHKGHNSLLAAANILINLHAIPRHGEGASRITVGMLSGGSGTQRHSRPCQTRL